jgi:hypothetical protein
MVPSIDREQDTVADIASEPTLPVMHFQRFLKYVMSFRSYYFFISEATLPEVVPEANLTRVGGVSHWLTASRHVPYCTNVCRKGNFVFFDLKNFALLDNVLPRGSRLRVLPSQLHHSRSPSNILSGRYEVEHIKVARVKVTLEAVKVLLLIIDIALELLVVALGAINAQLTVARVLHLALCFHIVLVIEVLTDLAQNE